MIRDTRGNMYILLWSMVAKSQRSGYVNVNTKSQYNFQAPQLIIFTLGLFLFNYLTLQNFQSLPRYGTENGKSPKIVNPVMGTHPDSIS